MQLLSLLGLVLAFFTIIVGAILKGSHVAALWSSAAFVVVIIGTTAAVLVQTPFQVLVRAMRMSRWVIMPPPGSGHSMIEKIITWSEIARRQGLLGLEDMLDGEQDGFIQKGLQLLVDGSEPETIRAILEVEITSRENADMAAARVFESAGVYAPTMGIVGAVMGLMSVMEKLADPSSLGPGIAAAFVSTIYGIASANLLLLPIAAKLKDQVRAQSQLREIVTEGLLAIADGENPRVIETRLQGYLH